MEACHEVNEPPRGIPNVSGVACHLSSALQLVLHAVPTLRMALLEIAEHSSDVIPHWVQELASLTQRLFCDSSDTVNPMPLYDALASKTTLDPHDLGDAARALRVLLHTLQQHDLLQPILNETVMGGVVEQTVTGECIQGGKLIRRTKVKEKRMSCPFPIPNGEGVSTLTEALQKATVETHPILGMDWSQVSGYHEEQQDTTNGEDYEWTTNKTSGFSSLPKHLMLHLQRFHYENDSVKLSTNVVDIPRELDMAPCMSHEKKQLSACCCQYQFTGAILHVSDSNTFSEEEDGHYVALIGQTNKNASWYLLDDEKVTLLPDEEEVLNFVSGRPTSIKVEGSYCATVLVYSRRCDCDSATTIDLLNCLRERLQQEATQQFNKGEVATLTVDWSRPHELIGKRLRVRWKSGKYYSGKVTFYDEQSGKHCITYDDGDVRHYTLSKKTIEWLDAK